MAVAQGPSCRALKPLRRTSDSPAPQKKIPWVVKNMGSIKIQNVFAYLNIYLYSLAICRCSSMLFCFYSARKIDRKWWVTPPPPSSCDPGFPRRRNLAPKVSFNVRSITRTISASCGDGPQRNQGENHTKKRNNERKTLHPILFALSDFFLPFLFFVVFFRHRLRLFDKYKTHFHPR